MERAKRKNRILGALLFMLTVFVFCTAMFVSDNDRFPFGRSQEEPEIAEYAKKNGLSISDYPEELISLYERNEDARQFVLDYPLKKDSDQEIALSMDEYDGVPLLMQWDERWGYSKYGSGIIGLNGCGPVCLSMVASYLKNDGSLDPKMIAAFSEENGYYVKGNGTAWALMSEGAEELGLVAKELPLEESIVERELTANHPIICIMGEGDFTTEGHYIVLTGYHDGMVSVNDPNSYKNSDKLWKFSDIESQIKNLWSYEV